MPLYGVFRFYVFFLFTSFFYIVFFRLFYGATRTDPDGLSSCASHSDSLITLSYSMADFSANLFRLFYIRVILSNEPIVQSAVLSSTNSVTFCYILLLSSPKAGWDHQKKKNMSHYFQERTFFSGSPFITLFVAN